MPSAPILIFKWVKQPRNYSVCRVSEASSIALQQQGEYNVQAGSASGRGATRPVRSLEVSHERR